MEIAVIYATKHNHTKKVVEALPMKLDTFNVSTNPSLEKYDLVIFFCPTYGDEELPLDMEDYLQSMLVKDKMFVICELGNYYGYDDYEFGAMKIIKSHLLGLGWKEFAEGLSLDSLPKIDWDAYYQWCERLKNVLQRD